MSKVLKVVGMIAGAVALVAGAIATFGASLGFSAALIASASQIATIASLVSTAAMIGAQLTYKPPPARGAVSQVVIAADAPRPYVMGEGLVGGVLRYDAAYGFEDDIPNPFRWQVYVYCGHGPVQSISPRLDYEAVPGWYSGYLDQYTRLGAVPDTALVPVAWGGAPGWDSTSKLSGNACIGWNMHFDKKGKRFASGIPLLSAYGQWVKVYDPRLDSTFPGGSGAHRIDDEATWTWSENPALHALAYAYGRYQLGKKVMGIGLPVEGLDVAGAAAWASVCDANGWTIFGRVFEPSDRWANLKDICLAGGAAPIFAGGVLGWHYDRPRTALDTITAADLVEGEQSVTAMQGYADRMNTVVPKYIDPDNNWELMPADAVVVSTYVTEDGEEKRSEFPFNLVKNVDQAAQLASYKILNARELLVELSCTPRLRAYRPGECLHLDLPEMGLDTDAVIVTREIDPATYTVRLTLAGETDGKHAFALGLTGTPPPTPAIGQTGEDRDAAAFKGELVVPGQLDAEVVDTASIADAAVTDVQAASNGSGFTGSGMGTWQELVSYSVTMDAPGDILAMVTLRQAFSSGAKPWAARVKIGGTTVFDNAGTAYADSVAMSGKKSVLAGTHVVNVEWAADDSTVSVPTSGVSLIPLRRYK